MAKSNAGRPTVMTPEVLRKLEEAFAIGASDKEACFYADIGPTALYEYQLKHPEFAERKEALKLRPVLAARQKVVQAIESDVKNAQWYLERKQKSEFAARTEHTGAEGEKLMPTSVIDLGNLNVADQPEAESSSADDQEPQ